MRSLRESSSAKAVLSLLALTTFVWGTFMFVVVPVEAAQRHTDGSIILDGGTVYKIENGQRRGFSSAEIFFSHGYKFSSLMTATEGDRALPMGTNMTWADGTLVNDGGTIYIVNQGTRRGFTSAAVFNGLGFSFANARVGSTAGLTDGPVVSSSTAAHPSGSLILSGGTVWWISDSGRAGVPSMTVFDSYGWSFAQVVPGNSADLALTVLSNVTARNNGGSLVDDGTTTPPPTSSTGTLFVSLAGDTPAAGTAIKNAARVGFTKVNLTASGGDVVVDTWSVMRTGIANDSTFASVDIIDLSTNATINDSGKTFNTDHIATFSEDLVIPNGQTKSVMVAGNIAACATGCSGEQPRLALSAVTVKGSASVSGSFPIEGNSQTINTTITIGSAAVTVGAYSNATTTTLEVGRTAYTFLSFAVEAGSAEDLTFSQVKVYQAGSASLSSDLANIKLYKDGTFLANGVVSGNYVNFQLNETIAKGQTSQYLVKADVVSGSARTVQLGIWRTTDIFVMGKTYNTGITPTYGASSSASNTSSPVFLDKQHTISTGTLRVGKSNTVTATNVTVGSDQVLGAFEFEAKGEAVNITALTLTVASTTSGTITEDALQSVKLVNASGATVAGPTDVTDNALTVAFTDSFTVPTGVNHYRVLGTLATGGGWATNDTITVSINTPASAITARGDSTGQTITPTPASNTSANQQTVKAAGLTVTKNSTPTNKTVVAGSTGVLIGSWQFDATNSGEDIRITAIAIRASTTGKFNTLTLKKGTVGSDTALSPVNDNPVSSNDSTATSTFALSEPIIITKGTAENINLYANIPSNVNAGEVDAYGITSSGAITAYGVSTGNSATVTVTAHDGALLTAAAAGTLTIDLHPDNLPTRQVVHGSTGVSLAEVKLTATNESIDVTKLTIGVEDGGLTGTAAGTYSEIAKLYLKLNGTIIGNTSGYTLGAANTELNFQRGQLTVPEGTTGVKLSLVADIVNIGTNQPGTANADIKVGLGPTHTDGITAVGNGSNGSVTETYNSSTGSAVILHRSTPSVVVKQPAGSLSASSVLHRTEVSAVGNDIGLYRLSYTVATGTAGLNVTNGFLRIASCTPSCGGVADGSQLSNLVPVGTELTTATKVWSFTVDSGQSHGKSYLQIPAGATAVIDFVATIGLTAAANDSISTTLLGDTATTTNDTGGSVAAAFGSLNQGNFVWSDLNSQSSQSSALTTNQWYNGYFVSGLGATSTSTVPATVQE